MKSTQLSEEFPSSCSAAKSFSRPCSTKRTEMLK